MSYARTLGATASASASLTAGASTSSSSGSRSGSGTSVFGRLMQAMSDTLATIKNSAPPCATEEEHIRAQGTCIATFGRSGCDKARQPICPPPEAAPPPAPTGPKTLTGRSLDTSGAYGTRKLPVPAAAPAPVIPTTPLPEPEHGVPTWVWIAGGVAVLGTGAFLYSRRKAA